MKREKKARWKQIGKALCCTVLSVLLYSLPVLAAGEDAAQYVKNGMDVIYQLIAACMTGFGSLLLAWGLLEWGLALNSQDGGAQSMAFKRIASGMLVAIGPNVVPLIINASTMVG